LKGFLLSDKQLKVGSSEGDKKEQDGEYWKGLIERYAQ
jgi:hypothetical protein